MPWDELESNVECFEKSLTMEDVRVWEEKEYIEFKEDSDYGMEKGRGWMKKVRNLGEGKVTDE